MDNSHSGQRSLSQRRSTAAAFAAAPTSARLAVLLAPLFLAACAQIPASTVAESQFGSLSCAQLAEQTAEAKETMAAADQAKSNSWQAVLPFVVAARYGQASSAASEAERRLTLLAEQSDQLNCQR